MSEHTPNENQLTPPAEENNGGRRAMLAGIGGLAAGALLTGRAQAGPLDPPPGPIASTGKPLTEVEPRIAINSTNTPGDATSRFRITQPGSYYLTGNITGLVGQHGISIAASGVTIDLSGFLLRGLGTIQGNFNGVYAEGGTEGITVRNGHVKVMGGAGIELFTASRCLVEDVNVHLCLASGIRCGEYGRVSRCAAIQNTLTGISVARGTTVEDCTASNNGSRGISGGFNAEALIVRCVAQDNGEHGIWAGTGSSVIDCVSSQNAMDGLNATASLVSNCVARGNGASGITAILSSVLNCKSRFNDEHGIRATSDCQIIGNNCESNGVTLVDGAGIFVSDSGNRIESNHCTKNDRGISVTGARNLIIRNTCAGNTGLNWSLANNNHYGPIVNRVGVGTGAVSGNFSPSSLESTDPHANFTY
ncbi:MAG: right-handed parallel beta-helix repeat-containing protein [Phycisphaerales bacterium]|nr:right-handed parallel beta-helix repeat-containing protein [Phycisphaerales bacterium]